jgi:DNA-binding response OmpR family regulator
VGEEDASILVVEDDASLRMVLRVTLELEGFEVGEAETVASARAAVAARRPSLVFLDLHLGGDAADSLLDELRAAGIAVVIVSGATELDLYADRASGVIVKPFDPAELVAAARRFVVG